MAINNTTDIDRYMGGYPVTTQKILNRLREVIKKAAPGAEETINYGIPTLTLNGNLVHFGAYKNHIGFYPAPSAIEFFKKELSEYEGAKGSVKFPTDKPVPFALISRIVKFRVKENLKKAESKKNLQTCSKGHKYLKSSDCPTCPICEASNPNDGFLSLLSAPARRGLTSKGIMTLKQLAKFSEKEILELHGIGPSSLPKLRSALTAAGLSFKN